MDANFESYSCYKQYNVNFGNNLQLRETFCRHKLHCSQQKNAQTTCANCNNVRHMWCIYSTTHREIGLKFANWYLHGMHEGERRHSTHSG